MKSFVLSPFLNNALKPEYRLSENLRPPLCNTGKEPFLASLKTMILGQIRLFLGELTCWEWRKRGKKTRCVQPFATECDVNRVESKWYMLLFYCEN